MISPSDILHSKILIVDDQAANVLLLDQMLQRAGYDCIASTTDPSEVYQLHLDNRYDLILLDLQMPVMSGLQVMDELKKIEQNSYLPVLVITAQPDQKLRAFQAGAKDFISKPFELADVLARVRNMLEVRLLYREVRHYNGMLKQKVQDQATLLAISQDLALTLELQPDLILNQLREIIDYDRGVLFSLEETKLVSLGIQGIDQSQQSASIHIDLQTPENIEVFFNQHSPILIADVWSDDLQAQFLRVLLNDSAAALLEGMQSWMWVPLALKGHIIGGIGLAHARRDYFTSHHQDIAQIVANQAATTISNTKLYAQAQALAVLEERQNLARNLHDAINQSLFSAGLIAEVLPRLWERDQTEAQDALEDLCHLIHGAQTEMRTLLAELRPSTLTDSSLGDLLHLLGNTLSARINIPVLVTVIGKYPLPSKVQIAFYRVCQETLYNINKHAKASQVEINLDKTGNLIELRICDNGQGFNSDQIFTGRHGLSVMHERAETINASLTVTSQSGHGTELVMRWAKPQLIDALFTDAL